MADPGSSTEQERERVADELRRIRERVREQALLTPAAAASTGPPPEIPATVPPPRPADPEAPPAPAPPDGAAVNTAWDLGALRPGGVRGLLARALLRLLRPLVEAQTAFNSRQVQLDNALLEHLEARFAHTHAHYDRVLGVHGRHMQEIDERHLILQEELVAHVHDLVRRSDLVLAEAERGRMSLQFQLRDLRTRLARLEERLRQG